jgi:very-short-patch-repair endonuclease
MSTQRNPTLRQIAKEVCRNLRRAQTEAERLLWEELRDRKLNGLKFYRQYPLFVEWLGSKTFFVADFFCFERQLVIEVDGRLHDYRVDHDRLRTFIINQLGIRVVRFGNEQIEADMAGVLEQLRRAVVVGHEP